MLHAGDPAQVLLELFKFEAKRSDLFLREIRPSIARLHLAKLVEPFNTLADRLEVRQGTAEPAVVDIKHAATFSFFANSVLGLLLRADEKNRSASGGNLIDEPIGGLNFAHRLLQIDDVDAVALRKDIGAISGSNGVFGDRNVRHPQVIVSWKRQT